MSTEMGRRISSAISVRWTPALAARVEGRIAHRVARRRRHGRAALFALAMLGLAGAAYAFTRPWSGRPPVGPAAPARPVPVAALLATPRALPAPVPEGPAASRPASPPQPPAHRLALARPRIPAETVDALFAAADAARLAGRPADAVAPLTAIFTRHATDSRAAIAAYQLGRVWALDLRDPAKAAAAFTRAHDLDPRGPLAADAAAHAAEARAAAGGEAR